MHPALHHYYYSSSRGGYSDSISRIASYREVTVNPVHMVVDNMHKVFIPIDYEYAQFFEFQKETSVDDDYVGLQYGWGIMPYFEMKMPDANSGTFTSYGSSQSAYASVAGATISGSFTGTGLKFRSAIDDRGGVWRFVFDDGALTVDVSTWNATFVARAIQTVTDALSYGAHTYVATFTGDDPAHVPSGGAGTARGWIAANSTTNVTLVGVYDKPILIMGSPTPNWCDDLGVTSYVTRTYLATNGSHKDFAMNLKDAAFVGDGDWIPNHNTIGTATIFADVATDRTLKIDGGSDLFNTDRYTLGTQGTEIEIAETFQGVNSNDNANPIVDITVSYKWSAGKLTITGSIACLKEVTTSASYLSMFDALKAQFDTILFNGTELTIPEGTTQDDLLIKAELESWNGELIAVQTTGTAFQKSLVQAFRLLSVTDAMNYDENLGQKLYYETNATRIKIYPTVAGAGNYNTSFSWQTEYIIGIVPDAYNTLSV